MHTKAFNPIKLIEGLDENQLVDLRPLLEPVSVPSGKIIFRQGEIADSIFLLKEGTVSIRYKPDDGPPIDITEINPGGVFGWSAALGRDVYTSSAISMVDCILYRINSYRLAHFCDQNPILGDLIIDRLAESIAERITSMQSFIRPLLDHGIDVRSDNTSGDSKK